jgi:hypothetical protein
MPIVFSLNELATGKQKSAGLATCRPAPSPTYHCF